MGDTTRISWCDWTWNALRGCSRQSPGCEHCYAERIAARFPWGAGVTSGGKWNGKVELLDAKLGDPLRRRKPGRCFVASVSDPFHADVPFEFVAAMWGVMACAPSQQFQILTKRPGRMLEFFAWLEGQVLGLGDVFPDDDFAWRRAHLLHAAALNRGVALPLGVGELAALPWPLPNVWLGVTVEDRERAAERIPLLAQAPAAVRFLSVEPLLEQLDLTPWIWRCECGAAPGLDGSWRCASDSVERWQHRCDGLHPQAGHMEAKRTRPPFDQVIVGCESGPGRRRMPADWARMLLRQCQGAGVATFIKQLDDGARVLHELAEFPEELRVREWPRERGAR